MFITNVFNNNDENQNPALHISTAEFAITIATFNFLAAIEIVLCTIYNTTYNPVNTITLGGILLTGFKTISALDKIYNKCLTTTVTIYTRDCLLPNAIVLGICIFAFEASGTAVLTIALLTTYITCLFIRHRCSRDT